MRSSVAAMLAFIAVVIGLAGPPTAARGERGIRAGQPAPEIAGGPWINSEPLTLAALRGRVVYVEFWTYG